MHMLKAKFLNHLRIYYRKGILNRCLYAFIFRVSVAFSRVKGKISLMEDIVFD